MENKSAAERRLRQMKEMGVNAIRITHNPASSILLDVVAKMGLSSKKKPLIPGMEARKNMIMVAFLRKKRLIQKRKQAISGQIMICEP